MATNDSYIEQVINKLFLYFELECRNAKEGATSPNSGYYYPCSGGVQKGLCVNTWFIEKCAKSCDRCKEGKEIILLGRSKASFFHSPEIVIISITCHALPVSCNYLQFIFLLL
jgi:hypothetical protein